VSAPAAVSKAAATPAGAALNPRTWIIWSMAAVAVAILSDNPVYRGLVALAAFDVMLAWLPPGRRLRPLAVGLVLAALLAALVNLLAGHTGATVLVRLPAGLPIVGGPLTLESLAFGVAVGLGLVAAMLAVAPLAAVLEPHDVVDALPSALNRTGIAVAASLNLMSGFGRTFGEVRDAQRMRGWKPRGLRSWNEVLVPSVLTAIEDSVRLAEAMEARGFGAGRRSSFAAPRWTRWDLAVVATAVAAVAVLLGLRIGGVATGWQPYPTLSLPDVDPRLVAACLLLAVPALRGR
jgi:energy-coupling factor transport system permease protein